VADAQNFTVERLDPSGTWVPLFNAVWDIGWNAAPLDAGYMTGSSPWDGTWPEGFDAGMAGIPDGG
ncbi:MAG: hypothetical protein HY904_09000, partial [Deltaproteobacteria bacterium]|nr:hypothetical protein [Deltaproteobacteria bacterium]